jgi:hypothetical protein
MMVVVVYKDVSVDRPTLKREKIRVGNGEKLIFSTTILPQCQMLGFSGVQ